MTPEELVSELLKRGVSIRMDRDRLVVKPASRLSDAEREQIHADAEAVVALLRAPQPEPDELVVEPTVDAVLRSEAEARERRLVDQFKPVTVVRFRTRRGYLPLKWLSADEVRDLERREQITEEEIKTWARVHTPKPLSAYVGELPEVVTALLKGSQQ